MARDPARSRSPELENGSKAQRTRVGRISVISPMLDEAAHMAHYVSDLAAQDFDGEVELIVADGGSTDGGVEKLRTAAEEAGLELRLLDNKGRWVSHGLNACIRESTGDLIVRLDCHSRYPPDYVSRCAVAAEETGASNVGGIIVARGSTQTERAVACAMDTAFGGIGFYRRFTEGSSLLGVLSGLLGVRSTRGGSAGARVEADTVTFGAFRPAAFEHVGLFDESLRRNQDDEFNLRLRRAGGRIVLDPSIRVGYTPRGSLHAVFRQYYEYGRWKIPVLAKHSQLPNPRALAPIVFVSSLLLLGPAATASSRARRLLAFELALYATAAVGFGAASVRRRREEWRLLPRVVAAFPAFHLGYGI